MGAARLERQWRRRRFERRRRRRVTRQPKRRRRQRWVKRRRRRWAPRRPEWRAATTMRGGPSSALPPLAGCRLPKLRLHRSVPPQLRRSPSPSAARRHRRRRLDCRNGSTTASPRPLYSAVEVPSIGNIDSLILPHLSLAPLRRPHSLILGSTNERITYVRYYLFLQIHIHHLDIHTHSALLYMLINLIEQMFVALIGLYLKVQ